MMQRMNIQIAPSLLGIDYGRLNEAIAELEPFSDLFHVDVMDGNFVPNLSVGAMVVARMKTRVPLNCHLMVNHPAHYFQVFAEAGAQTIVFHAEATKALSNDVDRIHALKCRAGIAINPATPVESLATVLTKLDEVLVMSVVPGFGGQAFMPEVLFKVEWLRKHYPKLDIAIDGGIDDKTAPLAVKAGANILVAGSFILKAKDPRKAAEQLRKAVC